MYRAPNGVPHVYRDVLLDRRLEYIGFLRGAMERNTDIALHPRQNEYVMYDRCCFYIADGYQLEPVDPLYDECVVMYELLKRKQKIVYDKQRRKQPSRAVREDTTATLTTSTSAATFNDFHRENDDCSDKIDMRPFHEDAIRYCTGKTRIFSSLPGICTYQDDCVKEVSTLEDEMMNLRQYLYTLPWRNTSLLKQSTREDTESHFESLPSLGAVFGTCRNQCVSLLREVIEVFGGNPYMAENVFEDFLESFRRDLIEIRLIDVEFLDRFVSLLRSFRFHPNGPDEIPPSYITREKEKCLSGLLAEHVYSSGGRNGGYIV